MPNPAPTAAAVLLALVATAPGPRAAAQPAQAPPADAPDRGRALDRIGADSLRGHVSFLASDLLEGRDSPSRGLDLAAEYIAAQFRRAGLEPMGDDGYFQTADWQVSEPDEASFRFEVAAGGGPPVVPGKEYLSLARTTALDAEAKGSYKLDAKGEFEPGALAGRVAFFERPDPDGPEAARAYRAFLSRLARSDAALLVRIRRDPKPDGNAPGIGTRRLIDPEAPAPRRDELDRVPLVVASDPALVALYDALPAGPGAATATIHLGEPTVRPARLRNVVGRLKGSDPALAETCVMVTAHYDHLGIKRAPGRFDRIFNGANDDASGAASVLEIAGALGSLKPEERPRRSVLFVAFFGEEKGLMGSRFYGRHPVVPIDRTVADLNLEQIGRVDSSEGDRTNKISLTGFGYSTVTEACVAAGRLEGVEVDRHPRFSDAFFDRSDNQALADLGIPAHTLCVAYVFPDYHDAADHWDRLDYPNMARVDRAVARALLALADAPAEPTWDAANPRAAKYLKAWKGRHPR